MKKGQLIVLAIILTFTLDFYGQNNSKKKHIDKKGTQSNNLVGTWRLIEFSNLDSLTSKWEYPYGKNPRGYFTYTKNNIVNINICSESPLKISEDSAKSYNTTLIKLLDNFYVGYFGTYSIDWNKSIVTHHVKGGSVPWYIDTDQNRPFILKGDTLIIGNNKTWRRTLVRED